MSFFDAGRPAIGPVSGNLAYEVFLDSTLIYADATFTGQVWTPEITNFAASAGSHTLRFQQNPAQIPGDQTGFFDKIEITVVPEPGAFSLVAISLFLTLPRRKR